MAPSTNATTSDLKYFGMIRASVADTAGHISDGLMMAVFPAASAEIRGPRESATG